MIRLLLPICFLLALGCQPEPDNVKLLDQLVVQTNFDESADFSDYTTYSLALDTIGFISNQSQDTLLTSPGDGPLASTIMDQIKLNLDNAGFQQVSKSESPDLGVVAFIVNDVNLFQQVVYPDYYYPYDYYNYYSYYAYPYVQTYASNTGALVIELVDLKNTTTDNKVKVIWSAYLGDIVSTIDREKQSAEGIDQAFIQSPYLKD
jgi:hypothetical protein